MFFPAGSTHIELPRAGVEGALDRGIIPPPANNIVITYLGADAAPGTTYVDPYNASDAAAWLHYGVRNDSGFDLTNLTFSITESGGVAENSEGSATNRGPSLDPTLSDNESDYFAANITGAESGSPITVTFTCDQGSGSFEVTFI